jgi:hypothetical protein
LGTIFFLFKIGKNGKISPKYFKSLTVLRQVVIVFGLVYYQEGKDIVFRFIIEYSSLRGFWSLGNNRSILIWGFLKDDILACVEAWD